MVNIEIVLVFVCQNEFRLLLIFLFNETINQIINQGDMLENLNKYNIILASASPRRRELLRQIGLSFSIKTCKCIDESYPDGLGGEDIAKYISSKKANFYLQQLSYDDLMITADTIVYADGRIYGKPIDRNDALNMLKSLSGRSHKVITGVTIATKEKCETFSVCSNVTFSELSEAEIAYYVDTYNPMDKAGAYGIQEWIGMVGIKHLDGCFFNVMGLPLHTLYQYLKKF